MRLRTAITLMLITTFPSACRGVDSSVSGNKIILATFTASSVSDSTLFLTQYAFPTSIASTLDYVFYLHGKITEDQGLPAVSPEYGKYEYETILKKLASHGFTVISEPRPENADGMKYAEGVAGRVTELLKAGEYMTISVNSSRTGYVAASLSTARKHFWAGNGARYFLDRPFDGAGLPIDALPLFMLN